jgi:purine-binding chemotaxis protein CheW
MENYPEKTQSTNSKENQETLGRIELLQQLKTSNASEHEEPYFQLVVISFDDKLYGIRILSVREILKVTKVTWLPCTPEYILGVISVRGDIQPVVNLKNFLQLGTSHTNEHSRIILVESEELVAGLLVDDMVDIIDVPENSVIPLTESNLNIAHRYIEGKLRWKENMIALLNIDEIMQGVVVDQAGEF